MHEALLHRIDAKTDELIALTQDLIRIPTVNPPGEAYTECAEFIGKRLGRRGFDITYLRGEGEVGDSARYPRTNVLARIEGKKPGPCVHFNSHIDVVEPGQDWTVDPFGAGLRDGKIYGRGSCDMKGGLAASIIAIEAILEQGLDFSGSLEISGTVDEESGGYAGVAYMAKQGLFSKPRVDHVIIPEPLNVDRVCLGHRGVWWSEIETFGRIAHGSMPFLGDCAIRHMGAFLEQLEQALYPKLGRRKTQMPVVPEGARNSTLNINSIHGGLSESFDGLPSPLVPDSCRIVLDRRFLIEENLADVKQEVIDILERLSLERHGFRYRIRDVMEVLPTLTERDAPVAQAVAQAIARILDRPAQYIVSPGTYDQKHIARLGHLHDCVAYGPGILDLAHQPDEYVAVDDLRQSAKIMALAALDLLAGERI